MRKIIIFTAIAFLPFFSFAQSKHLFGDQNAIPPDFGKDTSTVLVQRTEKNKINKCLEETWQEYYFGAFKMVDKNEIDSLYTDKSKYRYVFRTAIFFEPASGSGEYRTPATNNYSCDVWDRSNDKVYGLDYLSGGYAGIMKNYVKELEKKRTGKSEY